MIASSFTPDKKFRRPVERLEERREEGEEGTNCGGDPPLFNTEVIICNVLDVGRLLLLLVSPPSLTGETGVPESTPLSLWLKTEDLFRSWPREWVGLSIFNVAEVWVLGRSFTINDGRVIIDKKPEL